MHIIKTTKEKLVEVYVNKLMRSINKALSVGKYKRIGIFLSGGSLKSVYSNNVLQEYLKKNKEQISLFIIDERYTSEILEDSLNDLGVRSTKIQDYVYSYFPIINSKELKKLLSPDIYINKYSKILNKVLFDKSMYKIGLMGVGNDYHTAGMFPNNKEVFESKFNSNELVSFHEFGKEPFIKRITLTMTSLGLINEFIIFLKGEEKKAVFEYLIGNEKASLYEKPCGIYKSLNTTIITDITS